MKKIFIYTLGSKTRFVAEWLHVLLKISYDFKYDCFRSYLCLMISTTDRIMRFAGKDIKTLLIFGVFSQYKY